MLDSQNKISLSHISRNEREKEPNNTNKSESIVKIINNQEDQTKTPSKPQIEITNNTNINVSDTKNRNKNQLIFSDLSIKEKDKNSFTLEESKKKGRIRTSSSINSIYDNIHMNNNFFEMTVCTTNFDIEEEKEIKKQIRLGFIRKVYFLLSIQLIITFSSVLIFHLKSILLLIKKNISIFRVLTLVSTFLFIICYIILVCNRKIARTFPYNYFFLFLTTLSQSFLCSLICSFIPFQLVLLSVCLTIFSVICLTIYAWVSKYINYFLSIGIVMLVQVNIYFIFSLYLKNNLIKMLYCLFCTLIIGGYIVLDTQRILGKVGNAYSIDDYILATLEIYIDVIILFFEILKILIQIFSKRRR